MKRPRIASPHAMTLYGLAVVLIVIDQASKFATEAYLPMQQPVSIIPFLSLYRTYNTGIAFSLLDWVGPSGLIAVSAAVTLLMLYLWMNVPSGRLLSHIGFAGIIAGAIGNLIDRSLYGYVIDMVLFHTETWAFAVFNLADSFITVGAGLIILDEILTLIRKPAASPEGD